MVEFMKLHQRCMLPWQLHAFSMPELSGIVHGPAFDKIPKLLRSLHWLNNAREVLDVLHLVSTIQVHLLSKDCMISED